MWMSSPAAGTPGDNVLRADGEWEQLERYLHPSKGARAARMLQFVEQQQELPSTIFAQVAGSSTGPSTLPNPQHYLASHSLAVNFKELFFSSSDLSSIYKSLGVVLRDSDGPQKIRDCPSDTERAGHSTVRCLARARLKDKLGRALSGLTLNAGASQRSRYIQGILFTPQTFPDIDYTIRGQLDFDPKTLFVSASDWSDAITILNSTHLLTVQDTWAKQLGDLPSACRLNPAVTPREAGKQEFQVTRNFARTCLDALAGRQGFWGKTLATLIPTVQFKKESQFDFIKQGGNLFVEDAFPEPSLNTFSFTFDLRRLVPSTKDRTDALNAMAGIYTRKKAAVATAKDQQIQILKDYIELAMNPSDSTKLKKLETDITPFILECQASLAKGKSCGPLVDQKLADRVQSSLLK